MADIERKREAVLLAAPSSGKGVFSVGQKIVYVGYHYEAGKWRHIWEIQVGSDNLYYQLFENNISYLEPSPDMSEEEIALYEIIYPSINWRL